jgi:hypothetical protein
MLVTNVAASYFTANPSKTKAPGSVHRHSHLPFNDTDVSANHNLTAD